MSDMLSRFIDMMSGMFCCTVFQSTIKMWSYLKDLIKNSSMLTSSVKQMQLLYLISNFEVVKKCV